MGVLNRKRLCLRAQGFRILGALKNQGSFRFRLYEDLRPLFLGLIGICWDSQRFARNGKIATTIFGVGFRARECKNWKLQFRV